MPHDVMRSRFLHDPPRCPAVASWMLAAILFALPVRAAEVAFQHFDLQARTCAVVGSFNAWAKPGTAMQKGDDGGWSVRVPLAPGQHRYAFLVDGTDLVSDLANRDFTQFNGRVVSVLTVTEQPMTAAPPVRVMFRLAAPAADVVSVVGAFNRWSATAHPLVEAEPGLWQIEVEVSPGEVAYKFVVDGQWQLDPAQPARITVNGVENSLLRTADGANISDAQARSGLATGSGLVRFTFTKADAQRVSVAGEFNDWRPGALPMARDEQGVWRASTRLPAGLHAYKFVADGEWLLDPAATTTKRVGEVENSAVRVEAEGDATPVVAGAVTLPVSLEFRGASFRRVNVVGDFNGWDKQRGRMQKGTDEVWRCTLHLPPGDYAYKFVAGDQWYLDPRQPDLTVRDGVPNSRLLVSATGAVTSRAITAAAGPLADSVPYFHAFEQELHRQYLLALCLLADSRPRDATTSPDGVVGGHRMDWRVESRNGLAEWVAERVDRGQPGRLPVRFPDLRDWTTRMREIGEWAEHVVGGPPAWQASAGMSPAPGSDWAQGLAALDVREEWGAVAAINALTRHGRTAGWSPALARDLAVAYAELTALTGSLAADDQDLPVWAARAAVWAWLGRTGESPDEHLAFVLYRIGRPTDAQAWLPERPRQVWGRVAEAGIWLDVLRLEDLVGSPSAYGLPEWPGHAHPPAPPDRLTESERSLLLREAGRFALADGRPALAMAYLDTFLQRHPESLDAASLYMQAAGIGGLHRWSLRSLQRAAAPARWLAMLRGDPPQASAAGRASGELPDDRSFDVAGLLSADAKAAGPDAADEAVPRSARRRLLIARLYRLAQDHAGYLANTYSVAEAALAFVRQVEPLAGTWPQFATILSRADHHTTTNRRAEVSARIAEWTNGCSAGFARLRAHYAGGAEQQGWIARARLASSDYVYDHAAWSDQAALEGGATARKVEALGELARVVPHWYLPHAERQRINHTTDYRTRGGVLCSNSFGYLTLISTTLPWKESLQVRERAHGLDPYESGNVNAMIYLAMTHARLDAAQRYLDMGQRLPDRGLDAAQMARYAHTVALMRRDFPAALRHAAEAGASYAAWALDAYAETLERCGKAELGLTVLDSCAERYGSCSRRESYLWRRFPDRWTAEFGAAFQRAQQAYQSGQPVPEDLRKVWTGPRICWWIEISDPAQAAAAWARLPAEERKLRLPALVHCSHLMRAQGVAGARDALEQLCNSPDHATRKLGEFLLGRLDYAEARDHLMAADAGGTHFLLLGAAAEHRGDRTLARRLYAEGLSPLNRHDYSFTACAAHLKRLGVDPRMLTDAPPDTAF